LGCKVKLKRARYNNVKLLLCEKTVKGKTAEIVPIAPIGKKASRLQICYGDLNFLARRKFKSQNKKLLNEKLSDRKGPLKGIVRQISIIPKSVMILNLFINPPCPFSVLDQSTLSQTSTETISTSPVRIGGVLIEYRFPENS